MKLFKQKSPEEKLRIRKDRILIFISAVLLALAFPPVSINWFVFIALIPLFSVISKRDTLRSLNAAGYLFGFIFSLLTVYWVGAFTEMKDPFLMIAGFALLFFNPLLFIIPTTLYYLGSGITKKGYAFLMLPFFWVTSEYVYMITDVSFPWLTLGHGLARFTHYIQIADHIGSIGLTLVVAYINLFLYLAFINYRSDKKKFQIYSYSAAALIILPLLYGFIVLGNQQKPAEYIKTGIIQPDLDPYEKWAYDDVSKLADMHLKMSEKAVSKNAKLIIWPETALPTYLLEGSFPEVRDRMMLFTAMNNVSLLTGMPHKVNYISKEDAPFDAKFHKVFKYYYSTFNAILLFNPESYFVQNYNKMKLVPFGEKTPYADRIPLLGDLIKWSVGVGAWNVGKDTTLLVMTKSGNDYKGIAQNDTIRIGGLVCYESVYPDHVAVLNQLGADFFVVVTNDSWYGNTGGPYQHKEFAALRAVETRRSIVRCANGGISCVIDAYGHTLTQTKMYTKDILVADVPVMKGEKTFYTKNPLLIARLSAALSVLILGMFWTLKLKKYFYPQNSNTD